MLKVSRLKKCYGSICPITNTNFYMERGLRVIYGENGSGKTTLMKVLAGIVSPTSGKVELKGRVSFMPQEPMLYEEYKLRDYYILLRYMGGNANLYRNIIKKLNINPADRVYSLSYGTKKAVFMAIVLSMNAEIYLLDEPFLGIDVHRRDALMTFLRQLYPKKVVLITESENILPYNWVLKGGVLAQPEN